MHHVGEVYSHQVIIKSHKVPLDATKEILVLEGWLKDANVVILYHVHIITI